MFIPDSVKQCVVYVANRLPSGDLKFQGTAFFVQKTMEGTDIGFQYLVTAKHVIQGIESLDDFDGKICLRINFEGGNAETIETNIEDWKFHPDESEVDVAVLPHPEISENVDISIVPIEIFLSQRERDQFNVNIGDDVFLTGLFYNHHGRKRNIPIVRVGNIAAMPEEKVKTSMGFIDAYLVEARSIGGLSGSPVFVNIGHTRKISLAFSISNSGHQFFLLGLMHGHFDIDLLKEDAAALDMKAKEVVNMGIAIVVPSEKILEVINQPIIRDKEIEYEKQLGEKGIEQS